jgi:hypothetical protein
LLAGGVESIDEEMVAEHLLTGSHAPHRLSSFGCAERLSDVDLLIR